MGRMHVPGTSPPSTGKKTSRNNSQFSRVSGRGASGGASQHAVSTDGHIRLQNLYVFQRRVDFINQIYEDHDLRMHGLEPQPPSQSLSRTRSYNKGGPAYRSIADHTTVLNPFAMLESSNNTKSTKKKAP